MSFTQFDLLPDSVRRLNLQELDIHFSRIKNIDILSRNNYLRGLDISYTGITQIPESLLNSKSLILLNISYTDIDVSELITKTQGPIRIKASGMEIPSVPSDKNIVIDTSLDTHYFANRIDYAIEDITKFKKLTLDFTRNGKQDQLVSVLTKYVSDLEPDVGRTGQILSILLIAISGEFNLYSFSEAEKREKNPKYFYTAQFIRYFKLLIKINRIQNYEGIKGVIASTCPSISKQNIVILLDAIRRDSILSSFSDNYNAKIIWWLLVYSQYNNNSTGLDDDFDERENSYSTEFKNLKFSYIDIPKLSECITRYIQNYIERADNVHFHFSQSVGDNNENKLQINVGYDIHQRKISTFLSFEDGVEYWLETPTIGDKTNKKLSIKIIPEVSNDNIRVTLVDSDGIQKSAYLGFSMAFDDQYFSIQENEFNEKFGCFNAVEFEILYLYVRNFRNLESKEYIFNDRYTISLDELTHTISICDNKINEVKNRYTATENWELEKPQGFFGNGISNIISFVGKNGTGKSSVIELFLNSMIFNPNGNYDEAGDYIIVFRRGDQIYWSDKNDIWQQETSTATKLSTNIGSQEYYRIVNTKVALISNIVDGQRISTNEKYDNSDSRKIILTTQNLLNGGEIPNADIYRIINYFLYDRMYRKTHKGNAPVQGIILRKIHFSFNQSVPENSAIEFHNRIESEYKKLKLNLSFNDLTNKLSSQVLVRSLQIAFLMRKISAFNSDEEVQSWINSFLNIEDSNSLVMLLNKDKKFDLSIINIEDLIQLLELIEEYDFFRRNIALGFADMSSGESARLTIFARVLSLFKMHRSMPDSLRYGRGGNYIIYFDEAELYFHPSWQRTLVNDMITFLENLNEKNECFDSVTLYFSSNSPFLLSDLPDSNVKYFQVADEDVVSERTFGQNIHILLKNSFFMEEGVTGEFAKTRIKKALDVINSPGNPSSEDIQFVNYICKIVGELILRQVITDEWHNKQHELRS